MLLFSSCFPDYFQLEKILRNASERNSFHKIWEKYLEISPYLQTGSLTKKFEQPKNHCQLGVVQYNTPNFWWKKKSGWMIQLFATSLRRSSVGNILFPFFISFQGSFFFFAQFVWKWKLWGRGYRSLCRRGSSYPLMTSQRVWISAVLMRIQGEELVIEKRNRSY